MKRILGLIVAAVLVGCLVGGAVAYVEVRGDMDAVTDVPDAPQVTTTSADDDLPQAKVEDQKYDFGTMQRGTTKSHDFTIRNVGKVPLKLKKGTATCKCTEFVVPEDVIAPGDTAKVHVAWTAKIDSGQFRQSATVLVDNDPLLTKLELNIEGLVVPISGVEPPEFLFDKIPAGDNRTVQVYVMAMLQDTLTVTDPVLSDPASRDHFDVKIEPVEPKELPNKSARAGVRVSLTAKNGIPLGRFAQWLSVKTNLPEAEKLEIQALGQVVGDISVYGPPGMWRDEQVALNVGNVKSSEGLKENLTIVVRGDEANKVGFEVKSVDPPELKVKIGTPRKLKDTLVQIPLEVEIPPGTPPMVRLDTADREPGKIVLSTTHSKIKELAIGVQFAVER